MNRTLEECIRERAYYLWLDSAKKGDDIYFWLTAERDILAEGAMDSGAAGDGADPAATSTSRRVNALVQLEPGDDRDRAA